jgi:2-methylcitrate dehydratase PrpD
VATEESPFNAPAEWAWSIEHMKMVLGASHVRGIVIHPAIDACVQLKGEYGLSGDEVETVELSVAPLVLELTGKRTPQTGLQGKFSVFHSTAAALIFGAAGEKQYSDECVRNPRVIALRDRIDAISDASKHDDEVLARVRLKDGRMLEKYVEHAIGSRERPMSDAGLSAKFHELADDILGSEQSARLLDAAWSLESLTDAAGICRLATPESQPERVPLRA